jgi:EAL domain-containing protein (putative c-di-GMP-specific phosphodiesterase class I)
VFLELAEESGSIGPIGDWVIRQACTDARKWMDEGIVERSFMVHVNVSTRQLSEAAFVERVMGTLRETNVDAAHLTLEITEKTMLNDNPAVMRTLERVMHHFPTCATSLPIT